jgi:hypothetical protein
MLAALLVTLFFHLLAHVLASFAVLHALLHHLLAHARTRLCRRGLRGWSGARLLLRPARRDSTDAADESNGGSQDGGLHDGLHIELPGSRST